ncbi:MAG: insulinase family protein [Chloroflexi bacterium]|nr:insulinase family protein [Chloroflexota bacterium]
MTVVAERPTPGTPRPYQFPEFQRDRLANGLEVRSVHLPGRQLLSASLVFRRGAADEPAGVGGATVLMARALAEGTRRRNAIELVEATERLGASLHAEASWDATTVSLDVPAARFEPALALLAEMTDEPTFPHDEVGRLRDERLNDLLQARVDPRRRVEDAFVAAIYAPSSPYSRPSGGLQDTVERLAPETLGATLARMFDPARLTLVLAGDLSGLDVSAIAQRTLGGWSARPGAESPGDIDATPARHERIVRAVHRPGSVQTEIRIGATGLPRRIPDFHALSVMSAILGGLFDSRLNRVLREEKGYTYGAGAGFELRRAAGPFAARAAVHTEVTVPAVQDALAELQRLRDERVTDAEAQAARDYLVGVFPLRFETAGAVAAALTGLVVHDLPDDELAGYRSRIEAVTVDDVLAAARSHLDVERMAIVLVGDVDAFLPAVEAAGLGPLEVERDDPAAHSASPDTA